MASDTAAMTALSESKAKWTDIEKLALLVSVINDTNPNPNWANVTLPQGRTLRASQTIFGQLKKEAAAHPIADRAAIPASKKRARKPANGNEEDTTGTSKKRGKGRKPKNSDRTVAPSPNGDDEEEKPKKKVKIEAKDEDEEEYGVNGETESQEDGVAA
ncbi:MAG: hypothetical protein Q9175_006421 [Cornicularia normoerica]